MWTPRTRILVVSSVALVATMAVVAFGGVSFTLAIAAIALLVVAALPASPRRYLLTRAIRVVGTLLVTMALVWLLVHNYPDQSRLDEPGPIAAMERYVEWLGNMVSGDLGGRTFYSEDVGEGISRSLPISLQLLAYSQVLALLLAIPGAAIGAQMRGRVGDVASRALAMAGIALPVFLVGPIIIQLFGLGELGVFGREIGWKLFPVVLYEPVSEGLGTHLRSMALPAATLAFSSAAVYLVLLRSEMVQQLRSDHALLARSKGLSPGQIVRRHAMRPASPATVAAIAAQSGLVLSNMIIVERLFSMPGFGDYVLVAIGRRDVIAVVGAIFVAALILAVVNLVADALLLVLDPRLDTGQR